MYAIFNFFIYGFFVNFWLAAGLYGLVQFLCGGISPPLLAIMADSAPKGTNGSAISLWIIFSALSGLAAVTVLGIYLPQGSTLQHVQKVLAINGSVPMLAAAFCFYMSSFDYGRIMAGVDLERTETIAKAIEVAPEIVQLNARRTINIEPHLLNEAVKKAEVLVENGGTTSRFHNSAINDSETQFIDTKNGKRTKSTD